MGAPDWVDVFPIEHGNFPASYVTLPEGILNPHQECWTTLPETNSSPLKMMLSKLGISFSNGLF